MRLYTCPAQKHGATTPLVKHPCGIAAKSLDDAGHEHELKVVGGLKAIPTSRRDEIVSLTGQRDVLVLEDGTVVQGSDRIVDRVRANPAR